MSIGTTFIRKTTKAAIVKVNVNILLGLEVRDEETDGEKRRGCSCSN